jgi:hypothetical protein
MPFFRRYAAGELTFDTTTTTSKLIDSDLTQGKNFWNGSWFYGLFAGDMSIIRSFDDVNNAGQLETPMAALPADTDVRTYEIHTAWNAAEIHAAINRAISEVGRIFPISTVDATLILQENKLEYSITGLALSPFIVNKVFIENPGSYVTGVATAGGATSITVQSVPSDITTSWKISIYAGTGAGQIRNYASNVGNVITVTAWTTQPDSTSKYAMWDPTEELYPWTQIRAVASDGKEFPDVIRFAQLMPQFYGMRIRIEYLALPQELSSDTDTTIVPKDYIVNKAISILHGQSIGDTHADRDLHFAEQQRYEKMADLFIARYAPHDPASQIPTFEELDNFPTQDDPLSWRG